jgi:3'-5' exoribonuclease
MAHIFINQIQPGRNIDDIYLISQPVLRSTTRGDLYIAMFVSDRTGKLNCRFWQATEELFNSLPKEGFIHIKGKSELYQNTLQIVANQVFPVSADEEIKTDDYLPRTEKNIAQMFKEVTAILAEIKNPFIKALVNEFVADEELMQKFCAAPAATQYHHSCIGGLLEHTHNMLNTAKAVLPFYPKLQSDLVLAGIFLHDMGKTAELSYDMAFTYTDSGQLLGHIVQTTLMVNEKVAKLRQDNVEIDLPVLDSIMHIIISHHGQYEFGSPRLPMTAEAFLVSLLDNIDAKINQVTDKIENEPGDDNWTSYIKSLEAKLYRKRVVE